MGRHSKKDVEYFPFYAKDGRTLHILEGKYACKGTGFFTNVFRFLCGRPDHHFSIEDECDRMWFFSETKCDEEAGMDMLNIMAITGKIDKELWKNKIIASQDFLDSVSGAYKNRINEITTLSKIREFYGITYVRNTQEGELPEEEIAPSCDVGVETDVRNGHTIINYTILKNIFDFWNEQEIIKHRDIEKYRPNINSALKKYTEEEIITAIKNYVAVYRDEASWWTHKWNIRDFLQRGLDRFCSDNFCMGDYVKDGQKKTPWDDSSLL